MDTQDHYPSMSGSDRNQDSKHKTAILFIVNLHVSSEFFWGLICNADNGKIAVNLEKRKFFGTTYNALHVRLCWEGMWKKNNISCYIQNHFMRDFCDVAFRGIKYFRGLVPITTTVNNSDHSE